MNKSKSILLYVTIAAIMFAGLGLSGCGDGDSVSNKIKAANKGNIRRLRNCYAMYLDLNRYKGPKDEKELMDFLKSDANAASRLERMGIPIEELDDMLVSERDGQPFKVRWGLDGINDHAIVFESEGVDGKYLVAFATPRELEKDEYDDYWTGKLKGLGPGDIQNMNEDQESQTIE
ncbi:hypothetical protein [Mariniblastus fucicola]|uniref:Uncharacterized protein n=1 Tax=Mariniblastus fucicola TaxID=980251 RepID=A0A5B9PE38_9BACT|nr:hypothetical protein [Mariniblastus fucicola]QEG23759.1 hypothetical protein MFFC18_36610 [Mariniblastus fucicola]